MKLGKESISAILFLQRIDKQNRSYTCDYQQPRKLYLPRCVGNCVEKKLDVEKLMKYQTAMAYKLMQDKRYIIDSKFP